MSVSYGPIRKPLAISSASMRPAGEAAVWSSDKQVNCATNVLTWSRLSDTFRLRYAPRTNSATVITLNAISVGGVAASFWATGDKGTRKYRTHTLVSIR